MSRPVRVDFIARDKVSQVADRIGGKTDKLGGKFAKFAKAGAAIGAAFVAGGAIVGGALFKIGQDFDKATDTIRVGTGATGKALTGLQDDFKAVVKDVPTDFASAGTAIADLNTRTGLTGKGLQGLAKRMLELTRLTGGDISTNVASLTRLFGDWSIPTKKQAFALDEIFRASQATGITVDRLSTLMVQFGSPLRQLGFDFETTAAMFAKFEKEGVNIETAMPGLRMALKNFAKDGKEPAKALAETIKKIKEAKTTAEANTLAFKIFGVRAGPDLAAAIREGRFDLDGLIKTIKGGKDTILGAAKDTESFGEKWTKIKNRVFVGLQPIASKLFDGIGKGMDKIVPKLEEWGKKAIRAFKSERVQAFLDKVKSVGKWFADNDITPQGAAAFWSEKLLPAMRKVGSFLKTTFAPTVKALKQAWKELAPELAKVFTPKVRKAIAGVAIGVAKLSVGVGALAAIVLGKVLPVVIRMTTAFIKFNLRGAQFLIKGSLEVRRAIAAVSRTFRSITAATGRFIGRIRSSFSHGVRKIGQVWASLRGKTRRPVNFMIDVVYNNGIRKLWNRVNNLWGGTNLAKLNFAQGGVLPGYAPGRDTVPAMLSPGEGILRPEVVRQLGSATIMAWNRAAKQGKPIHAFADGGVVGLLKRIGSGITGLFTSPGKTLRKLFSGPLEKMNRFRDTGFGRGIARIPRLIVSKLIGKAKDLLSTVGLGGGGPASLGASQSQSVRAIMAVARSFNPGARLTSGVRNTPDYHGRGLAADIVGGGASGMARIARGFYRISGRLLELIHSGGGGYFVKHGRRVGAGYYGGEVANHWDHVHVAARNDALAGLYDKGGVLPPGVSTVVNRTRQPEAVLTAAQWSALLNALAQPAVFEFRGDNSKAAAFVVAVLRQFVSNRGGNVQKAVMGKA